MSLFRKLASRGYAVIKEWHNNEGMDATSRTMIAELGALTLLNLCGDDIKKWSREEKEDRVNAVRVALTSAYQIGKHTYLPAKKTCTEPKP